MTKVIADISMSLDGFVTGPNAGIESGLGDGGEVLHTWAIDSDDPVDVAVLEEATIRSGAVIMGRRLFDIIDGPQGWNDEMGYGAAQAATPPFLVVTHHPPESIRLDLDFTFVTGGVGAAIAEAKGRVSSEDVDVVIMGGGDVVRQAVIGGLADELRLHIAPAILGGGTPLFAAGDHRPMVQSSAQISAHAVHTVYDLR